MTLATAKTRALLVRRVPYGESDLIVTLFTEQAGAVGATARGARRTRRRFVGLEPMHLQRVELLLTPGKELATLVEVQLERPRLGLTTALARMEAAGQALRWLRQLAPPRTAEPQLWVEINALLDALDQVSDELHLDALVGAAGLRMIEAAGWGLDLSRCVRCERPCPEQAPVLIDVTAGGVVCRRCGGGPLLLSARERRGLLRALDGDESGLRQTEDAAAAQRLVRQALVAHGEVKDPTVDR